MQMESGFRSQATVDRWLVRPQGNAGWFKGGLPGQINPVVLFLFFAALGLLFSPLAVASKALPTTLRGCVVDKTFYSVSGRAYAISLPQEVNPADWEGKEVSVEGLLLPGDRFIPKKGVTFVLVQPVCPPASLRLIRNDQASDLGITATSEATAGRFDKAMAAADRALALQTPPQCDTYTVRAHVLALKGELAAASQALSMIRNKQCEVAPRVNPLLLQDVSRVFRKKGDKQAARDTLQLAISVCEKGLIQTDLIKELASLK